MQKTQKDLTDKTKDLTTRIEKLPETPAMKQALSDEAVAKAVQAATGSASGAGTEMTAAADAMSAGDKPAAGPRQEQLPSTWTTRPSRWKTP